MKQPVWYPEDPFSPQGYNISTAAVQTGFNRRTIRRAIDEGHLPANSSNIIATDDLRVWYLQRTGSRSQLDDYIAQVIRRNMAELGIAHRIPNDAQ